MRAERVKISVRARASGRSRVGKIARLGAIMIAVPGNFAHPTVIGFMEPIH
jgi:hypothetical protein